MEVQVDYLAVLIAAIVSMAIGFLWYSPAVLGKPWMKERGFTQESLKTAQKGMGMMYGVSFVLAIITAYMLSHVMFFSEYFFGYPLMQIGLTSAFFMWFGFVMPVQASATIFSDKKNWKLWGIDTGYQLVSLLTMGLVIGVI